MRLELVWEKVAEAVIVRKKGLWKMAELRFVNVGRVYGDGAIALEHASFDIRQGEFLFLIGRSGAGKSTVLKLAGTLEQPTSGEIYLDGVALSALPRTKIPYYRRRFGIMDPDVGLLEDRDVLANVLLPLRATGYFGRKAKQIALHACGITGIAHKLDRYPRQLSGGERARAMLARAIAGSPQILLLDEPTANLDGESSWDFMRLLEQLNQGGMTVLAASHDHQMVSVMKKRVITLSAGNVVADERRAIYNMRAADILEERRVLHERQKRSVH